MAAAKMLKKDLELLVAQLQAELAEVKAQRDEIAALKEQAAEAAAFNGGRARSAGRAAAANAGQPVITRFFRGGQLWVKTRAGNKATERLATPEEVAEMYQQQAAA